MRRESTLDKWERNHAMEFLVFAWAVANMTFAKGFRLRRGRWDKDCAITKRPRHGGVAISGAGSRNVIVTRIRDIAREVDYD
jgi:hypothetical protein